MVRQTSTDGCASAIPKPDHAKTRKYRILSACTSLALTVTPHAAPLTGGSGSIALGGGPVTNEETASPTIGDGPASSADTEVIFASMPPITLANVGDKAHPHRLRNLNRHALQQQIPASSRA
ncbi:MAG: hypothetical protein WED15_02890 [Akkermansiaceae bacterium]